MSTENITFCIRHVNDLSRADRIDVVNFLYTSIDPELIQEISTGCAIFMDNLPSYIIDTLKGKIQHKLEN